MTYEWRGFECSRCQFVTHAVTGELLPDGWHLRDGQDICDRCWLFYRQLERDGVVDSSERSKP